MFHNHEVDFMQEQPEKQLTGTITTGTYQPHQHFHMCEHDVKYCAVCDVCYCTMCGKEWHFNTYNYQYYPYTITYNWQPDTINGVPISIY